MNILIITTWFVPDSAIAAVRPYMFAKHLSEFGENVTVLRSGEFELPPFDEYNSDMGFEVISSLGENCDAEKFVRGEYEGFVQPANGRYPFIPQRIKMPLKFLRDMKNVMLKRPPKCFEHPVLVLNYHKKAINRLFNQGRKYDVVFSTCGSIENIFAGRYAARVFDAAWIMDFRDSMIMSTSLNPDYMWNIYAKRATICALKEAECITAVSDGLCKELKKLYPRDDVLLLNNGYDERELLPEVVVPENRLTFCYAGRLYEEQKASLRALVKCLSNLISEKRVDKNKIKYYYAGSSGDGFRELFDSEGMADILVDKGYLSKGDALRLELASDVFTVSSWNTTKSQGILTGKFYEGIKTGKPILTLISGNMPNSELMQFQEKYNYGFCYETCNKKTAMKDLENYIESLYNEKLLCGRLSYIPSKEIKEAFGYGSITMKLHGIMQKAKVINNQRKRDEHTKEN